MKSRWEVGWEVRKPEGQWVWSRGVGLEQGRRLSLGAGLERVE
jgi:hypothetical protein